VAATGVDSVVVVVLVEEVVVVVFATDDGVDGVLLFAGAGTDDSSSLC